MIYPINTKIRFSEKHPHSNEYGVIIGYDLILGKSRHKIKLEQCIHGVGECYAMKLEDMEIII